MEVQWFYSWISSITSSMISLTGLSGKSKGRIIEALSSRPLGTNNSCLSWKQRYEEADDEGRFLFGVEED
ncbi:hypothetical protein SCA6_004800 [Theobroma cacao]